MAPVLDPPPDLGLVRDESLAGHTYMRIGGPAAFFGTPVDGDALERIAAWTRGIDMPLRVIGGGSNVLVSDAGVRAVVVSLRAARGGFEFDGATVRAGAAVMLPALARAAAARDLGGLEFAIGIPGSVGGALQTNAGIGDGRSIGPLVRGVEVLRDGRRVSLAAQDVEFAYRTSSLRDSGDVVLAAELELTPASGADIEAEMRRLLEARQASQPTAERNAGSIFRNPPDDFAGRLIEQAGCKGMRSGGAEVSELHANFIVHDGSATASDVAELMRLVQLRVLEHAGVTLVPEIEWWGDGEPPEVFREPG
jgi:UDP-N-acetylmuramate dehydrogenase